MIYRRVNPLMWDDDVLIEADDFETRVWLGLLTGPHVTNLPGLLLCSSLSLAEAIRRPPDRVLEALRAFEERGRLELDEKFRVIRLPNAPKHNPPENPKVLIGWWKRWCELPESPLKYRHVVSLRDAIASASESGHGGDFSDAWARTFGTIDADRFETVSTPSRNPIPYPFETLSNTLSIQKQDQDQDQDLELDLSVPDRSEVPNDFDLFWSAYPRKIAKAAARKAWTKTKATRPPLKDVLVALSVQKCSAAWTRDGGQYVPHPATWLNAGRWEDEVPPKNVQVVEIQPKAPWEIEAERMQRIWDEKHGKKPTAE